MDLNVKIIVSVMNSENPDLKHYHIYTTVGQGGEGVKLEFGWLELGAF